MLDLENEYYKAGYKVIAGCDEAGRGCLCGPVIASAVVFPIGYKNNLINDSKKLTPKKRDELYNVILKDALAIGICAIEADEIDKINIYEASKKAMIESLKQINNVNIDCILTDAMPLEFNNLKSVPIIKGDSKALSIAAASIIAKVTRDRLLDNYSYIYPDYKFNKHKGYSTKLHVELINKYGIIKKFYRETYSPVKEVLYPKITLF